MKEAEDIQAFLAPYIESGEENEKIEFKQELSLATNLSEAAVTILAEIHGRSGHFPTIIRRKPVTAEGATHYELAEAIDLAAIRDKSRAERR